MKLFKKKEFDLLNEKIQEVTEKEDFIEFLIKSICPENVVPIELRASLEAGFYSMLVESVLSGNWDKRVFHCKKHWKLYRNKIKNCKK